MQYDLDLEETHRHTPDVGPPPVPSVITTIVSVDEGLSIEEGSQPPIIRVHSGHPHQVHHNPIVLNLLEQGRGLEWLTSFVLLWFAISLWVPGNTFDSVNYSTFQSMGIHETIMAIPLAAVAFMRMVGLHINGRWKRSPMLRMIGAIAGAGAFAMLGSAFLGPYVAGLSPLSTGPGVYFLLALSDTLAAYRSGTDVRMAKSGHE